MYHCATKQLHNQKSKNTTEKLIYMGLIALCPWTMGISWECVTHANVYYPVLQNGQQRRSHYSTGTAECAPPPICLSEVPCVAAYQLAIREPLPTLTGSLTSSGPLYHPCQSTCTETPSEDSQWRWGEREWQVFLIKQSTGSVTQGQVSDFVWSGGFAWVSPKS